MALVDLHLLDVNSNVDTLAMLEQGVIEVERLRGRRYRLTADRRRFLFRRAELRRLLGQRLDRPPLEVAVHHNAFGRPSVDGASFSLAHSRDLVLIALSDQAEVGCDLEWIDPQLDWRLLAADIMTPHELEALNACGPHQARGLFFQIWTVKEALLKGRGSGLSGRPQTVETLAPGGQAEWRRWTVRPAFVTPDHAAAVAVEDPHLDIRRHVPCTVLKERGQGNVHVSRSRVKST